AESSLTPRPRRCPASEARGAPVQHSRTLRSERLGTGPGRIRSRPLVRDHGPVLVLAGQRGRAGRGAARDEAVGVAIQVATVHPGQVERLVELLEPLRTLCPECEKDL